MSKRIERIREPGAKWTPNDIGSLAPIRPSMFSARTGTGMYSHAMPPASRDAEHLQASLLAKPRPRKQSRRWLWTCIAAVLVLSVIAGWPR